jgi:hypothetical protein
MGVNHPSVESSDLTTARKIMPHATSPKGEKAGRVCDQGADMREREKGKTMEKYRVSASKEEGE